MSKLFGVDVIPLRQIVDVRGSVMHMLRSDDSHFQGFGEIYFSTITPGIVKGWHGYVSKTLCYACVHGKVRLVLFDNREWSDTFNEIQQVVLTPQGAYNLVIIPPGIMNAFEGVSPSGAVVAVCTTEPFDEERTIRWDLDKIEFDWSRKNG